MERGILVYFLKRHGSEVLNMLFTEWNLEDAIAVRCEEAREDTWEVCAKNMLAKGYSDAEVIDVTNLSPEQVCNLRRS